MNHLHACIQNLLHALYKSHLFCFAEKSLLIHSILAGYPIPPVFLLKYKNDDATIYDCIEGKQRLLNTFSFMSWEYALHGGTPDVELDGEVYEIAGRSFDELSDELKDIISGYRYSISVIEDATEEEVEDIFYRLNSPTPLTQIQRSRSVMGTELARWTRDILDKDFFTKAICLTQAQWRREGDLEVLLQTMLLLDNRSENYEYKAISNTEVLKYCSHIRGRFSPEKRVVIEELFDYLSGAFSDKCKFLKKSAVPMVAVIGKLALENSITPEQYRGFIDRPPADQNQPARGLDIPHCMFKTKFIPLTTIQFHFTFTLSYTAFLSIFIGTLLVI